MHPIAPSIYYTIYIGIIYALCAHIILLYSMTEGWWQTGKHLIWTFCVMSRTDAWFGAIKCYQANLPIAFFPSPHPRSPTRAHISFSPHSLTCFLNCVQIENISVCFSSVLCEFAQHFLYSFPLFQFPILFDSADCDCVHSVHLQKETTIGVHNTSK